MIRRVGWPLVTMGGLALLLAVFLVVRFGFGVGTADAVSDDQVGEEGIRVAVVTPGTEDDLSATQSLLDGLAAVRGVSELAVTAGISRSEAASAALRTYADDGYDLIVADSSEYGAVVAEVAADFPRVAFAWGPAADTFGLGNVSSYTAAADEGGYVLGALAADMCTTIGLFGPIELPDAKRYLDGFKLGATAGGADVDVVSVGAFDGIDVAADMAAVLALNGADCLSGTGSAPAGGIGVAEREGLQWFGTESDQTSAAADGVVVAGQIYEWEVALQDLIDDVARGSLGGNIYGIDLDNGGLVIEFGNVDPTEEMMQLVSTATAQVVARDVSTTIDG